MAESVCAYLFGAKSDRLIDTGVTFPGCIACVLYDFHRPFFDDVYNGNPGL